MFNFLAKFSFFLYGLSCVFVANGQSASDTRLLNKMTTLLSIDSSQVISLESVFKSFSLQLDSVNTKIKEIQTSELSEEEISEQTSVLHKERKEIANWKKEKITSILTPDQNVLFKKEILAKSRPVVHFGHDKADCNVCEKPKNGAINDK